MWQAVLLGVTATISHTLIVWGIGLGGMYLWRGVAAEALEPYFQLASGAVIVLIAAWMFWRTWREQHGGAHGHSHDGDHEHLGHMHGPEPHATGHRHDSAFVEPGGRRHDAIHEALHGLEGAGDQDAHQLAHANAIRRRFTNRNVSNWQIAFFGLTGGLIPCPAAVTVLLLCLQLKEITLGAVLVLCFSIGLAITLVTVGAVAALWCASGESECSWISAAALRAPYLQAC